MRRTLLWLVAFLAFSLLTFLADGAPLQVMSAPNLLRVGTKENIFVECQDCTGGDIQVTINVMNHPTKNTRLASTPVTLRSSENFQAIGQITIPAAGFNKDPNVKQYVYLQAQFPDRTLEKVVLVSFQSGYIFIQTDKTLYTPNSKVYYRMFALTPSMEPIERDESTQRDASIAIEIVTTEGIVLPLDPVSLKSGFHSGDYQLGEIVSPGLWKVVAKFHSNPQQSYTADFEVKEYVLPSFEVKLTPATEPFFYVDSVEFTVNIKATYLFGKEVDGMAYVVFGVTQDGQKKSFPSSLQRVQIENGEGVVTLKREHITDTFPDILQLVGNSIYVAVSVLTESGGEMVEAELRNIQIVTSPYTIHFKRTPRYYKPGMSFDVSVEVINPDDTPAQGVTVVVNPGGVRGFTAPNGMARLTINTQAGSNQLSITANTDDPRLTPERQASATMEALPYGSNSGNYIHIGVDAAELELGQNLRINLMLNRQLNQDNDITYLILSRGQLIQSGRYRTEGQVLISLTVPITQNMLPSFRIVAYFHTSENEVVADSVWVDVKDSCMGSLKLESARPASSYEPRKIFGLKVTGDPGATVGLVAVDKGVYVLNNKHRLTQKKVWDIVEKYDTGCTPGGGKDSMSVFYDAGLLFESNAAGTPYRQDLKCPARSRRKRAEEDDSYTDSNEITSRSQFPESWLWANIKLPSCAPQRPNCDTTSFVRHVPLQDSITTWQFTGISLSRTHGICVGDPLEVIVRKDFFIDLRLPYSAVRGEQIEVKAILHNYSPDHITVRVDLFEQEHVCSAAFKRGKYRQELKVGPQSTRSVPFIIIPMKIGQYHIQVKAAVRDSSLNDGVMRQLQVVPEGVLIKSPMIITLNPAVKGVGGKQQEVINSKIPLRDLAPNTPASTLISLTGREQISAENPVSTNSMGTLISQPSGDGESNMILMSQAVIATVYLDKTNQWETVGLQKREEALKHILAGYWRELTFRKNDGSFAVFASHKSSTWLTAYVLKVFSMANNLVTVQKEHICGAVTFLILHTQQPDGIFVEIGRVHHGEMIGDVRGADSEASMTAFCLIALQESRHICDDTVFSLPGSINKAVAYLEKRLPHLTNPYAVAMTSYALANENKLNREILYNFVSQDKTHWPVPKGNIYTLEATAYALLALVRAKVFDEAAPVFRWFNQQQRVGGGYGSVQATMMVYQALAEYRPKAREPEYDLNVDVMLPGRSQPSKFHFNTENHYTTRTSKINDINQNVTVTARGTGEATLTMVSLYYVLPREKESDCQKFNLSVQLIPVTINEDEKIYKLRIEVLYLNKEHDATMSILDIGLLTGFTVNTDDLNALYRRGNISRYEMDTVLSERSSLVIYLDKVSHTQPEEIAFRVHQTFKVGVLQPAAVNVYEYYDSTPCLKFYHPEGRNGELLRLCRNNECTCAEVLVQKDFFIDLRLPFAAVRGEQLEVKAVLHNYNPDALTVRLDLMEEEHVCSAASKRGKYQQEVKIGPQTTRSVPFIIIPTRDGQYHIEVRAAVKDSMQSDGIRKKLLVVPEGILVKSSHILTLDPEKKGTGGTQVEMIRSEIPVKDFVPNSPTSTQISVTGREQADMLRNEIDGKPMGDLIYEPSGCGEENMIHMTLPVIATTYLDTTNMWDPAVIERRSAALQHIKTGYLNELAYRKLDGSYAANHGQQSSTWLTAYVAKVFALASNLVEVKKEHICGAVRFLFLRAQGPNGLMREVGRVYHRGMIGDVGGLDSDVSMTAFCLIAAQESRTICADVVNSLQDRMNKSVAYLEKRLPHLTNPYAVAMASYALANENKLNWEMLYKFTSPDQSYWQTPWGRVYTLEATAYSLLALVRASAFEEARTVVRWFNKQQRPRGEYGSTQATLLVYQAVAGYWGSSKGPEYDLNVDILLPGRSKPDKFNFNSENQFTTRTSKMNDINQDVKVTASGKGEATLTMVSLYYALPKEKESDCQKFNLSVQLIPDKIEADETIYRLRIEVLFKDADHDAAMTALDIGLLTGFEVNTNDLSLLSKGRARTISNYKVNKGASDRGSLIIFLDKVSHTRPEEIVFRVHQKMKVGVLQPAAVSVYEYNDQHSDQARCVKFYHPERRAGQLLRLCRNDVCTCAEENCSMQKKGNFSNAERMDKACETLVNSRVDYVYKIRLQDFTDGLSTDIYTVQILDVIKEGNDDVGPQGKLRTFLSYPHCRAALNLKKGKNYLLMGVSKDIYVDHQSQSYQYVLGERTWIEYWPTQAECKTQTHKANCEGLNELAQLYRVQGCRP